MWWQAAALAHERVINGQELTFQLVENEGSRLTVRDRATGSIWSWESGECLQGPFEGRSLRRVTGSTVYWEIWAQFHRDTELVLSGL